MKLLADLSLLSSPYTWMTPPGRAPSPDVGDVLLARDKERDLEDLSPLTGRIFNRRGWRIQECLLVGTSGAHGEGQVSQVGGFFLRILTSEPQELASVQDHGWGRRGVEHGGERREAVTGGAG